MPRHHLSPASCHFRTKAILQNRSATEAQHFRSFYSTEDQVQGARRLSDRCCTSPAGRRPGLVPGTDISNTTALCVPRLRHTPCMSILMHLCGRAASRRGLPVVAWVPWQTGIFPGPGLAPYPLAMRDAQLQSVPGRCRTRGRPETVAFDKICIVFQQHQVLSMVWSSIDEVLVGSLRKLAECYCIHVMCNVGQICPRCFRKTTRLAMQTVRSNYLLLQSEPQCRDGTLKPRMTFHVKLVVLLLRVSDSLAGQYQTRL